ncbi:MAG: inositol 2-dehydrogenase [Alphaproteobacteria bacterium]|nr:inositol 2-dehydrogenase [Alphaproteobacteria bacterium]
MMQFALIGAGFIGPVHAANIAAHPRAQLRYVVDLNRDAASRVAGQHGAAIADSLDVVLADAKLDAVVICTPPRSHAAIIEAAARAGKAIFCEKPIDLDIVKVDACGAVLRKTGVPFFVGFNRRFDPTHSALHEALRRGDLGRAEMVIVSSRDPEISPPDYVAAMPYGIFYDTMIHDFDMVRWLTRDEPVEVYARTSVMLDEKINPVRDPDTAMVTLVLAGGALVHVNSSFRAVYGYDQRIEVFGEKGMLISRNQQPTSLERHGADGIHQAPLHYFFIQRYVQAYAAELDHFVTSVETCQPPSIGFEDGRRALAIAYAAMESAKSGRPVALPR